MTKALIALVVIGSVMYYIIIPAIHLGVLAARRAIQRREQAE